MDAIKKGNIAEFEIAAELTRVDAVRRVAPIANQHDPNHYDLLVTLEGELGEFKVQVKWYNEAQRRLPMDHVRDWFAEGSATVPMWWREESRQVFWADPIRRILRRRGMSGKSVSFSREDLRELNSQNPELAEQFVKGVTALMTLWPGKSGNA